MTDDEREELSRLVERFSRSFSSFRVEGDKVFGVVDRGWTGPDGVFVGMRRDYERFLILSGAVERRCVYCHSRLDERGLCGYAGDRCGID